MGPRSGPGKPYGARGGFTVIEVILTLCIFMVMMGFLLPKFLEVSAGTKANACLTEAQGVAASLEAYFFENESLPENQKALEEYRDRVIDGRIVSARLSRDPGTGIYRVHFVFRDLNGYVAYYPKEDLEIGGDTGVSESDVFIKGNIAVVAPGVL
ncbi:MAG: hypothetical protein FWE70_06135 [Oscillospiraceae bacterium]|nr:hypothetical protein [Oscillospiraceae bacterium]